jgi:hypothetical protein
VVADGLDDLFVGLAPPDVAALAFHLPGHGVDYRRPGWREQGFSCADASPSSWRDGESSSRCLDGRVG